METSKMIIALTAIVLGSLTVLIPITGITARIALKPLMEAMSRYREMQGANEAQQLLERRLALMEEQLHSMERQIHELAEESDFRRQLEDGARHAAALPAPNPLAEPVPAPAAQPVEAEVAR